MSKKILVAAHQLHGGTAKGKWVIEAGAEITAGMRKSHGLDAGDLEELIAKGAVQEVSARTAPDDEAGEIAALRDIADKAVVEARRLSSENAALTARVAELEAAQAGAPPAEKAADDKTGAKA